MHTRDILRAKWWHHASRAISTNNDMHVPVKPALLSEIAHLWAFAMFLCVATLQQTNFGTFDKLPLTRCQRDSCTTYTWSRPTLGGLHSLLLTEASVLLYSLVIVKVLYIIITCIITTQYVIHVRIITTHDGCAIATTHSIPIEKACIPPNAFKPTCVFVNKGVMLKLSRRPCANSTGTDSQKPRITPCIWYESAALLPSSWDSVDVSKTDVGDTFLHADLRIAIGFRVTAIESRDCHGYCALGSEIPHRSLAFGAITSSFAELH